MKKIPETPEEWAQWRAEAATEAKEAAVDAEFEETVNAYADPEGDKERSPKKYADLTKEELNTDWENMRRHAIAVFPEGRHHKNLTGSQKVAAIAHCMGWSNGKISAASGISAPSIGRWLKRPDVINFINEFQIRTGEKDPEKLLSEGAFLALKYGITLLKNPEDTDSMRRIKLDAGKWLVERKYGKPNQPVEHKGPALVDVFKHMQAAKVAPLTDEEENELFN